MSVGVRIAIVGPIHPIRGGIALYTARLAAAARERGHEVEVLSYRRLYPRLFFPGRTQLDPDPAPALLAGLRVEASLDSLSPASWVRAASRLARGRPELVALQRWHPFFAPALATVARAARRGGARVVWLVHNARPHEGRSLPWGPLLRLGLHLDDRALVHASSEAEALRSLGVRCPIRSTPMPAPEVPREVLDPAVARRSFGIDPGDVVFLFLGYVRAYKGVDVLVEALRRLAPEGPRWSALVLGEWYVDRSWADRAAAAPPLAGRLRIVDRYAGEEEVARALAAATVAVLPYRWGSQSAVVPLCFAHGRGVVTTRVGGLPEAIEHGVSGLLVEPGDAAALAEALEEIRRGRRFAPAALERARARMGFPALVETLEELC